jgi:hypothetical protein
LIKRAGVAHPASTAHNAHNQILCMVFFCECSRGIAVPGHLPRSELLAPRMPALLRLKALLLQSLPASRRERAAAIVAPGP